MPKFFYTAITSNGERKQGAMEAKDEHGLAQALRQEGLILVEATLEKEKPKRDIRTLLESWQGFLPFLGRVSLKDKIFFVRNLRIMIASGLPFPRALRILSEQTKSKKFKETLLDAAEGINKGESFSKSLERHPEVFSELFQNMIRVAEEAGTLEDVLKVLAEQMEKEQELKSKIIGALIYPAVIIAAMVGIGVLMLIVVVPQLAKTFEELEVELPATTQFVISLGVFLAEKWYWALLIVFILLILLRVALRTQRGKRAFAWLVLRFPVISALVQKTNSAATVRTLSSLIAAGVPLVRSLEIMSRALGNIYFREAVREAAQKVKKGEKLARALKPYAGLYPALVLEMIEIGEETGETSSILAKLADFYEEEVGTATKNLSAVIEPLLMLFIGAVVGFFAISMIQPIYAMLQAIQ